MRLLKLTLAGFKSFADKTEIAFDKPIVGIVGPNGCGKSNVVDAIKWVLGEQSAKSLRGGAMQDVIFNGSAARPPSGMAMVTLTFDNPVEPALLEEIASGNQGPGGRSIPRKLPVHADIVEVTRKLFRDGTSDYEINGQRARLRDVKETFLDTGVGTDAYSVIEQGKVSRMLEANPKERRLIFEEAAGISRFKARKKEAQRKLEKTEQNLTLCRNRLEETGARLRSMKMQAARARSWQEYNATLKDLQLRFGLAEYHTLTSELDGLRCDLAEADTLRAETSVELAAAEAELAEVESRRSEEAARLTGLEDERRGWHSRMEQARMKASLAERQTEETRANTARDAEHAAEIGEHLDRHGREAETLAAAVGDLAADLVRAEEELAAARETNQVAQEEADAARAGMEEANRAVIRLQREAQGHRSEERSLQRFAENMAGSRAKLEARLADAQAQLAEAVAARDGAAAQLQEASAELSREEAALAQQKSRSEQLTGRQGELSAMLAEARDQRSVIASRHSVLSEMERKNEGVAETVKAILPGGAQAAEFPFVRGMLASLIEADTENAALVEAALGEYQQALVAETFADLLAAKPALDALAGRVSFVAVDGPSATGMLPALAANFLPAVSALVRCPDWLKPLVDRLLGRTLIVRDLDAAHMARLVMPKGLRFVTKAGQVLDADGRVQAGPLSQGNGLISRRSELAELTLELAAVEARIAADQAVLADISQQAAFAENARGETQKRLFEARTQCARHASLLDGLQVQAARLEREAPAAAAELAQVAAQMAEAEAKCAQHAADAEQLEVEAARAQEEASALQEQIAMLAERAETARERVTEARMESAALAEKRDSAERALRQHGVAEADLRRQQNRLQDQLQSYESRLDELARAEAEAEAEAGEADGKLQDAITRCDIARAQNAEAEEAAGTLRERAKNARQTASQAESAAHKLELRAGNLTVKSETVRERVHEQLGMNLDEKYRAVVDFIQQRDNPLSITPVGDFSFEEADEDALGVMGEEGDTAPAEEASGESAEESPGFAPEGDAPAFIPETAEADDAPPTWLELLFENCENPFALDMAATKDEMEELQGKIQRLGTVNLDAIAEEQVLEGRNDELAVQVRDIEEAKLALESLIEQINVDSRGRFEKTFAEIQANFAGDNGMFRRIFGGGKAELKLIPPDEVDENGEKVPAINADGSFDVLEAGIEIFAQPPGKRPAALSQLSGGEKTMTALALLMAIFGTRPSPYAILDEVDAALDEANVDRYVKILKSFLHTSHFIVITHRKPTMQGCDALYGITMQERGVSKRVKVNVEEVSAEGSDDVKLSAEATARQDAPVGDAPDGFAVERFEEPKPKKRSKVVEEAFAAVTEEEKETVVEAVAPVAPPVVVESAPVPAPEVPVVAAVVEAAVLPVAEEAAPAPVVEEPKVRKPSSRLEAAFAQAAAAEAEVAPVEVKKEEDAVRAPGFPDLSIKAKSDSRSKMAMMLFGRKE